jgi:hypothetical protein
MQEGITRHDAGTPSNHWHQINALSGVKVLRVLRPENRPLGDTAFRTANAPQAAPLLDEEWFKLDVPGHQSCINAVLRAYLNPPPSGVSLD